MLFLWHLPQEKKNTMGRICFNSRSHKVIFFPSVSTLFLLRYYWDIDIFLLSSACVQKWWWEHIPLSRWQWCPAGESLLVVMVKSFWGILGWCWGRHPCSALCSARPCHWVRDVSPLSLILGWESHLQQLRNYSPPAICYLTYQKNNQYLHLEAWGHLSVGLGFEKPQIYHTLPSWKVEMKKKTSRTLHGPLNRQQRNKSLQQKLSFCQGFSLAEGPMHLRASQMWGAGSRAALRLWHRLPRDGGQVTAALSASFIFFFLSLFQK